MIVDLGLLELWRHAMPPLLDEWAGPPAMVAAANAAVDFAVEGPDADAATALFGNGRRRAAGRDPDRPRDPGRAPGDGRAARLSR